MVRFHNFHKNVCFTKTLSHSKKTNYKNVFFLDVNLLFVLSIATHSYMIQVFNFLFLDLQSLTATLFFKRPPFRFDQYKATINKKKVIKFYAKF